MMMKLKTEKVKAIRTKLLVLGITFNMPCALLEQNSFFLSPIILDEHLNLFLSAVIVAIVCRASTLDSLD